MTWFELNGAWNVFRRGGDLLHLSGTAFLLLGTLHRGSTVGLSWKTQFIYLLVFLTRYTDLWHNVQSWFYAPLQHSHALYLILFKSVYIAAQMLIMWLFYHYNKKGRGGNYEEHKDTCPIAVFLVPAIVLSFFLAENAYEPLVPFSYYVQEVLWTFSEFAEAFAMIPQYVFLYRAEQNERKRHRQELKTVDYWILSIGLYRMLYVINWCWKKLVLQGGFQIPALIGGLLQITFFLDYIVYRFSAEEKSFLRQCVLVTDDKVNEVVDQIEMNVAPSRKLDVEQRQLRRRNVGTGSENGLINSYAEVPTNSSYSYGYGNQNGNSFAFDDAV